MAPKSRSKRLKLLVTVGTTRFDELINEVISDRFIDKLIRLGFARIALQVGKSDYDLDQVTRQGKRISIEIFNYKTCLKDDIEAADLVIGHAGAGTCLEVLRANRDLLIVTNEKLMDNHQAELADQLARDNYVVKSSVEDLVINLETICDSSTKLSSFPSQDDSKFEEVFNEALRKVLSRL